MTDVRVPVEVYVRGLRAVSVDEVYPTYELILSENESSGKETWLRVSVPRELAPLLKQRVGASLLIELVLSKPFEPWGDGLDDFRADE